jgi:hypothetical protein
MNIGQLKARLDSINHDIARFEQKLKTSRNALAAVEKQIAEAEKPVERFPVGSRAMMPMTVQQVCRDNTELTHLVENGYAQKIWVRECDLVPVPEPTTKDSRLLDAAVNVSDAWEAVPDYDKDLAEAVGELQEIIFGSDREVSPRKTKPLTAERIEAALRLMRFRSAGVGAAPDEWMVATGFAKDLAEKLGAVAEPDYASMVKDVPHDPAAVEPCPFDEPKPTISLYDSLRVACDEFREAVLHGRYQLAESVIDSDITNEVLGLFDDTIGAALGAATDAEKGEST